MKHFARNLTFATALFTSGCPFAPRCWETATCPFIDSGVDGGSDAALSTSTPSASSASPVEASGTATTYATTSQAAEAGARETEPDSAGDAADSSDASAPDASVVEEPDANSGPPDASRSNDAHADSAAPPRSPCDDESFVVCDAVCIDPRTNNDFCGATNNCESVGERCSGGDVCAGGECRNWQPAVDTGLWGHTAVLSPDGRSGFAAWVQPDDHDNDSNTPDIGRVYAARWDGIDWSAPARLTTTAGDSSGDVRLAVDATGATVAWEQREESTPQVYAAHWNGAAWNTTHLAQGKSPQVAADDGESVVVWTQDDNAVYAARRTNAGWGDAEPVSPIYLGAYIPVVATREREITVAWLGETEDHTRSIYAATSDGGGWSDAQRLSTNIQPATSYGPAVAVGDGKSWVSWQQGFDHDNNTQTSNVNQTHAAIWDGSAWSPSIRVSPEWSETSVQQIAADGDGALLVWAQREDIGSASAPNYVMRLYASVRESSAWSKPTLLSDVTANVNNVNFSVAYRDHYALVAWTEYGGSLDSYPLRSVRWDGSNWSEPALLSGADKGNRLGAVSLTADGTRAWVSWRDGNVPLPGALHINSFW